MSKYFHKRAGQVAGAAALAAAFAVLAAFSPAISAQGKAGLLPDFTELYERNGPAVVSIDVTQKARRGRGMPELSEDDPVFRQLHAAGSPDLLRHVDGDHRRTLLVVEFREVGQSGGADLRRRGHADGDERREQDADGTCGEERTVAMHHGMSASLLDNEKRLKAGDDQRRVTELAICRIVTAGASPSTVTRFSSSCRM